MTLLTSIDLFAGAGGLSYGLKAEGFQPIAAVEIDPVSAKSYGFNHQSTNLIVNDIRQVSGIQILKQANISPGELDLLTGCPPCQAFSTLRTRRRKQQLDDPNKNLIIEMLRLVRSMRPRAVIVENVPGLADDEHFNKFRLGLRQAGYRYTYAVLNASDFGVPQRRKRLILVALRGREIPSGWSSYRCERRTVRDAIGHLVPAGTSGDPLHDLPENRTPAMISRIKATPKNGGSRRDISPELQCACHVRLDGFKDVYGRMAWDDVSPTITSGCNNPSRGRFLHPEEHRAITLREAALLQTFPKNYQFCLDRGKEHVASQIGNAFPPDMIRPIARVISRELSA
ncbi:DNA cytosine methyltransferase [Leptolyngbya sp. FACHB-541]|uniref:DNA cytosine methyltransferase n=1 Tax=Leptolyngbya sp. FACHB-541 TaxID=2692810 RepID=UPI0016829DA1|nr:DNA cytosine methyltransferase [Leptolyngbya sp. FACHB-541]MBD1997827.1 DNA cytosine methyltransferase [Leptolyngbya sp. FACHB-541]